MDTLWRASMHLTKPILAIHTAIVTSCLTQFVLDQQESILSECEQAIVPSIHIDSCMNALLLPLDPAILVLATKAMQIVMRRAENRSSASSQTSRVRNVADALTRYNAAGNSVLVTELLKLTTVLCRDTLYTNLFVNAGVALVAIDVLKHYGDSDKVALAALGAIQVFCCTKLGRHEMLSSNQRFVHRIGQLLQSNNEQFRTRASEILHNLSIEMQYIIRLREAGVLSHLVELLVDPSVEVCRAVAGTIQNISHEVFSRDILLDLPHLRLRLIGLLTGSDASCQAAALGALLNLLGPSLSSRELSELHSLLSDGIALGAIKSCLFDTG